MTGWLNFKDGYQNGYCKFNPMWIEKRPFSDRIRYSRGYVTYPMLPRGQISFFNLCYNSLSVTVWQSIGNKHNTILDIFQHDCT